MRQGLKSALSGIRSPLSRHSGDDWSPRALFMNNESGVWFDPSDLSTMFQDAVGRTPVTAVEQPVGLILDKSKNLTLGSELAGGVSVPFTVLRDGVTTTNSPTLATVVAGATYEVTLTISENITPSQASFRIANLVANVAGAPVINNATGTGQKTWKITALASGSLGLFGDNVGVNFTVTAVSVKRLSGSHAYQATSAARPVLRARVNMMVYSEDFANAAWTKTLCTVTPAAGTNPFGANTATRLTTTNVADPALSQNVTVTNGNTFQYRIFLKYENTQWFRLQFTNSIAANVWVDLLNGVIGTNTFASANLTPVGDGWYMLTVTGVATTSTLTLRHILSTGDNSTTEVLGSVLIFGSDLRTAGVNVGLPNYQRIAAATDYDTNGFPAYLEFDGTDDGLATTALTLGSPAKADLILGVRKLVDTAAAVVVGMGNNAYTQPGALVLTAPDGVNSTYGLRLTGTGGTNRGYSIAAAAPDTSVLSYGLDIGSASLAQNVRPRRNAAVPSLTSIGAGFTPTTFSDVPLFIGVNGTSGARFNGRLYGLIVRFGAANLDATAIANAETWMNRKTRAY